MGWLVVVAHPQKEPVACEQVRQHGFECWFPRVKQKLRRAKVSFPPLFPRYLFARFCDGWPSLLSARGVSSVLLMGESPALISDAEMSDLFGRCDSKGIYHKPRFDMGQPVIVKGGPFDGLHGAYAGSTINDLDTVLLPMLGAQRKVVVSSLLAA